MTDGSRKLEHGMNVKIEAEDLLSVYSFRSHQAVNSPKKSICQTTPVRNLLKKIMIKYALIIKDELILRDNPPPTTPN